MAMINSWLLRMTPSSYLNSWWKLTIIATRINDKMWIKFDVRHWNRQAEYCVAFWMVKDLNRKGKKHLSKTEILMGKYCKSLYKESFERRKSLYYEEISFKWVFREHFFHFYLPQNKFIVLNINKISIFDTSKAYQIEFHIQFCPKLLLPSLLLSVISLVHYEKYNWDPGDPGEQLRDFWVCSHFFPESL